MLLLMQAVAVASNLKIAAKAVAMQAVEQQERRAVAPAPSKASSSKVVEAREALALEPAAAVAQQGVREEQGVLVACAHSLGDCLALWRSKGKDRDRDRPPNSRAVGQGQQVGRNRKLAAMQHPAVFQEQQLAVAASR